MATLTDAKRRVYDECDALYLLMRDARYRAMKAKTPEDLAEVENAIRKAKEAIAKGLTGDK